MTDGQLYIICAAILAATTWKRDTKIIAIFVLFFLSILADGTKPNGSGASPVVERSTRSI